uniref:Transporter n=1 Tax=Cyprinus carpio TaxID=7962 RepID=A0A8C2C7W5_CYPCA
MFYNKDKSAVALCVICLNGQTCLFLSQMTSEKLPLPADGQRDQAEPGLGIEQEVTMETVRDRWDSKVEYFLAQLGFSVGLGNVWRFPYLCHQNGGGAFILLYVLLMGLVGVPLFFLELAAGQSIRQGSIGVWRHISPKLVGIGYSSCVVCFFVALYYNVIIGWSIFYLGSSFQYPLPWETCPTEGNRTVKECAASSPTAYFWYRKALDITDSIDETGEFNLIITGCLLAAWVIVCLAMYKGIKSTGKVMYFSSVFPYVVLLCFLIRGVTLDGASEGIKFMFYPRLEIWADVQVWRQAATQVFFALGLGFGSVIAYSSYNPRNNNCHRDAFTVSGVNFMTSVLATLVVFAVLGFRAKTIATECLYWNVIGMLLGLRKVMAMNKSVVLLIKVCDLLFLSQGVEGTGLAFIAFTEAMTLFPGSPFWSALFFLMLLNLGLSTMFGTMAGILTPLTDTFKTLRNHKFLFTACSCVVGFLIGLMFTQRCGNYFVTMFDDYSATLPLIIVVIFQTISVAWVYGADRFLEDLKRMLDRPVPVVYKYMWKYVCPVAMLGLLGASLLKMFLERPTYIAWNREKASKEDLPYPDWALAVLSTLIIVAFLPVPVGFIHSCLLERLGQSPADAEAGYMPCATTDLTPLHTLPPSGGDPSSFSTLLEENQDTRLQNGHIEHFETSVL